MLDVGDRVKHKIKNKTGIIIEIEYIKWISKIEGFISLKCYVIHWDGTDPSHYKPIYREEDLEIL